MHFRDRGRSVQLVRTTHGAESKKPQTEVLGRLTRPGLVMTEATSAKLTDAERVEVEGFRTRNGRREALQREYAADHLVENVNAVLQWLATTDHASAISFAEDARKPVNALRKALNKLLVADDSPK